jgi:response regulator RpfG family c-di-GMP phosphodiesterase
LTVRQNDELKELNNSLEKKVELRTLELKNAHDSLIGVNKKLKNNFLTSIKVFSNVIEMRSGKLAGHSRRVADLARKLAIKMQLTSSEVQEIFVAGLLADIGKIGFSDELINTPINTMDGETLGIYLKHTSRAEQLLMPLDDLQGAAKIIRAQHERFDGEGFPDGLLGAAIPLSARILTVANDYYLLQIGAMSTKRIPEEEAKALIIKGSRNRYDVDVVEAFKRVFDAFDQDTSIKTVKVTQLLPGMVLANDIISPEGLLLLPADYVLDENYIEKLQIYDAIRADKLMVNIHLKRK